MSTPINFNLQSFFQSLSPTAFNGQTEVPLLLPSYIQTAYTNAGISLPVSALLTQTSTYTGNNLNTAASYLTSAVHALQSSDLTSYPTTSAAEDVINGIATQVENSNYAAGVRPYNLNPVFYAVYNGFLQDFAAAQGIEINIPNTPTYDNTKPDYAILGGDWQPLVDSGAISASAFVPTTVFGNPYLSLPTTNPFVQSFDNFLTSYQSSHTFPTDITTLLNSYHNYLSGFAKIGSSTDPSTVPPDDTPPYSNLASYENYYMAVVPNATHASFLTYLNTFYNSEVSSKGYFLPTSSFSNFVTQINATNPPTFTQFGHSSISGTDSSKALILNRIIALLIKMINALQNAGIAQSQNLTYLTQYQNAYTALIQQIPTFLANGVAPIGIPTNAGGTIATQDRQDINSSLNGIFADNLRSLRDVESNQAKTVQSNINTTNDAVNQQTDMATTFLQQMNQLLGAIFR